MDVFELRRALINDYSKYITSFININNSRINHFVCDSLEKGILWPEPLIQLNPSFEPGEWINSLVDKNVLHEECRRIFRIKSEEKGKGKYRKSR